MPLINKCLAAVAVLMLSVTCAKGQTVISGTVRDTASNPVAGAAVYLSRTTIGNVTGKNGDYSFTVNQSGEFELTASCVGFKSVSVKINTNGSPLRFDFSLKMNTIDLNEIVVSSKDRDHGKNIKEFMKLFMGETINAEHCRLLNPEDLHLYSDPQKHFLKGFSLKPLMIENRMLGYSILYDLTDFSFDREKSLLRFSGNNYFKPSEGRKSSLKRWERNRLKSFYGSRLNFLRALVSDSLPENDFRIFAVRFDSLTGDMEVTDPITAKDLILSSKNNYLLAWYPSPVYISYTSNHPELETSLTGYQLHRYVSYLEFHDTIKIYKNGYYDKPYDVTWHGVMSEDRVADLVPYDYRQGSDTFSLDEGDEFNSKVSRYLRNIRETVCGDQVFVHTDRNLYRPGDTIWFNAYIRDRYTDAFLTDSKVLYMILFNPERTKADSARFRIISGSAPGYLVLGRDAKPGTYHLTAFTETMQNSDPDLSFQTDISVKKGDFGEYRISMKLDRDGYRPGDTLVASIKISDRNGSKLKSHKFSATLFSGRNPVKSYEKRTGSNGEAVLNFIIPDSVSMRPRIEITTGSGRGESETTADFPCPFGSNYIDFRFLPEGGNLVQGVNQRIGFNATDFEGNPILIKALLRRYNGSIIDTIHSGKFGPGVFSCMPEKGDFVEITEGPGTGKRFYMPDPDTAGYSLSARQYLKRSVIIEVSSSGYNGEKVYLAGTMNSNLVFSRELVPEKSQGFTINTSQLPSGVMELTLFNSIYRPVATRLIYINADKRIIFKVSPDKTIYKPGEEASLSVSATDGDGNPVTGYFSVSVADSASGYDRKIFTPGIDYSMNFSPGLSGSLPAEILLTGPGNLNPADLDVLFLVYGWSRYRYDISAKQVAEQKNNYDIMRMKILYASKNRRAGRKLDLVSLEGPVVFHLTSDKDGEITFPLDSLPDFTRSVTLMPYDLDKHKVQGAMLGIPFNEKFFNSPKLFRFNRVIPEETEKEHDGNFVFAPGDSTIEIPGVTIRAGEAPAKVYHDKYEKEYQFGFVMSLDYEQLWSASDMDNAIRRLTSADISSDGVFFRQATSMFGGNIPALVIFNGMPIYVDGYSQVRNLAPSQLTSLTIVKDRSGFARYGEAAGGGLIFVNTFSDNPDLLRYRSEWKMQHTDDRMLLPIWLYRPFREFYSPSRIEMETDPFFSKYSTTFWNSEVLLNGEVPSVLKYRNLNKTGPVRIVINGVSNSEICGSARATYFVDEQTGQQ